MKPYLEKTFDWNDYNTVNQYDELSLWSAPFGLMLLENMPIKKYSSYLDIATGTGFPLIDIKQRIGSDCKAYGIDPWKAALSRARNKINAVNLQNTDLIEGSAEKIDFADDYFDLITCNLGVNNFENQSSVYKECFRVLKVNSPFCITTNLTGQFSVFYEIFERTAAELNLPDTVYDKLINHVNHRGTAESHRDLLIKSGFKIRKEIEREFRLRYLNGTAFLNNTIIMSGFLPAWKNILENENQELFFDKLECNLNMYSENKGELKVNVPMLYVECFKD